MAIPDFQTLMLPVLQRLASGRWKSADLIEAMATQYNLTVDERKALLPSGRQAIIENRTHWAVAHLYKSGLIARIARGQYEISNRGRGVLDKPPERITIGYLKKLPGATAATGSEPDGLQSNSGTATEASTDEAVNATPEERMEIAARDLGQELAAGLLVQVRTISPAAFERLIIDLLLKIGYGGSRQDAARHLGASGDGGIDGVIREDALGLDSIYIQAKRYAEDNPIGAPVVQGFAGALLGNGATKGVFVTTSRFTKQARTVAAAYKTHRIVLIDGEELAQLMIGHEIGVRTVQEIRIQRIDLDGYEGIDAAL